VSVDPRGALLLAVVFAALMAVAGWRGGWLGRRPRRVRHDTLDAQIAEDFPPAQRAEVRALIDQLLAHARPDDHDTIWRRTLDAVRGDLPKLRRALPNSLRALDRLYQLLGTTDTPQT
jgi:hypothetical protein